MKQHVDHLARGLAFSTAGLISIRDGERWLAAFMLLGGAYSLFHVIRRLVFEINHDITEEP
jgi:hypothetical protein